MNRCTRFVGAATRLGDVKIWEALLDKTDAFVKLELAMELKGHKRGVCSMAFSAGTCWVHHAMGCYGVRSRY